MKFCDAVALAGSLAQLAVGLPQVHAQEVVKRVSSGCGKTQWPKDFTHYRFGLQSSGKDRSYSYHIPENYDKNKPYPVVVGFHGSSSVGLFLELDTKLSQSRYSADVCTLFVLLGSDPLTSAT
jgi:poly(3-hydroxybutyrate) depolymerase